MSVRSISDLICYKSCTTQRSWPCELGKDIFGVIDYRGPLTLQNSYCTVKWEQMIFAVEDLGNTLTLLSSLYKPILLRGAVKQKGYSKH